MSCFLVSTLKSANTSDIVDHVLEYFSVAPNVVECTVKIRVTISSLLRCMPCFYASVLNSAATLRSWAKNAVTCLGFSLKITSRHQEHWLTGVDPDRAQGLKKQKKQKHKLKDRSSSSSERDPFGPSEFHKSKKDPKVMELHRRPSVSHGRGKPLQKEGASGNEIHPRTIWERPTTRFRSREISRSSDELSESRRFGSPNQTRQAPPCILTGMR